MAILPSFRLVKETDPEGRTSEGARQPREHVPWGEVFIGKKSYGITPLDPITLPTGPQTLLVKNPELNVEKKVKVNVPPGGTARVRVNLME